MFASTIITAAAAQSISDCKMYGKEAFDQRYHPIRNKMLNEIPLGLVVVDALIAIAFLTIAFKGNGLSDLKKRVFKIIGWAEIGGLVAPTTYFLTKFSAAFFSREEDENDDTDEFDYAYATMVP